MTSLLPGPATASGRRRPDRPTDRPASHRPLAALAPLAGAAAAAATLTVCLGIGVVGWFLTDAGAHGAPRDALRAGSLGWLLGHGSGLRMDGVQVTAAPLLLTLVAAWTIWRIGHRLGDAVSAHGPDADRIVDGERDWTMPAATGLFAVAYVVVVVVTASLAATPAASPGTGRAVVLSTLLCLAVGGPAIAVGSGRAAIWAALVPPAVRASTRLARSILVTFLGVAALALLGALLADIGTAANVMSQLNADPGGAALYLLLAATLLPNAVVFAGSYLLGPGFTVGVGTLVSPTAVQIGPLPMFPLFAALPDNGATSAWTAYVMVVPVLVAAVAAARGQRRLPAVPWVEAALRGCSGGVLAGVGTGMLAAIAGGAVGPGRMRDVGPLALDVTVYAVSAFGIGGLVGALAMTWWRRRDDGS